jgi:hypothetical protein
MEDAHGEVLIMEAVKKRIVVTDDNWADYFDLDYPESLVFGLKMGEGGIDRESRVVTRLLAWVARESGRSPDLHFEMSRHDAAVLLEQLAGWPDG